MRRRTFLAGFAALAVTAARADALLDGAAVGLVPNSSEDQTAALRAALERAVAGGRPLVLAAGEYVVGGLEIPGSVTMIGMQGQVYLRAAGDGPIARISGSSDVVLEGIGFSDGAGSDAGQLEIDRSAHIKISRCRFIDSKGYGIKLTGSAAAIDNCDLNAHAEAGIFSLDASGGVIITNCEISDCGNAGIQIWGSSSPHDDRSIVMGNMIRQIRWDGGGNGQNGNGINVFRADNVIITDNQIADCGFSAVRLNTTNNTQVRGNTCLSSGEVAIFSEFAFSGSVIEGNIVDGAATGISITNLDQGGRLAVCANNIVRNITPISPVNPDTRPVGIYAEAETSVTGNAVDAVPGFGIMAGYGPYLRNVVIANNVVSGCVSGIGVSVVDNPPPGPVRVSGNMVSGVTQYGIAGMAWDKVVSDDLERDAGKYPHVRVSENVVTRG